MNLKILAAAVVTAAILLPATSDAQGRRRDRDRDHDRGRYDRPWRNNGLGGTTTRPDSGIRPGTTGSATTTTTATAGLTATPATTAGRTGEPTTSAPAASGLRAARMFITSTACVSICHGSSGFRVRSPATAFSSEPARVDLTARAVSCRLFRSATSRAEKR
jgi:hypothetical protein